MQPGLLLPVLTLAGIDSFIVVTGQLRVTTTFAALDVRTFFIGGRETGNKVGLDIGNGGNLSVNLASAPGCILRAGIARPARLVVGKGSFTMASGGRAHLCETFVFMASGYGKVPVTDGTLPCSSPCAGYLGTISIGSGAEVDWAAPNRITRRRPTVAETLLTGVPPPISPYEDLGLWTEAGGSSNTIGGGGSTSMAGVFFLGNADAFTLAGNAGADVLLNAQFISTRMKVTGGAVVNLVLSPYDSIPAVVYEMVLVR